MSSFSIFIRPFFVKINIGKNSHTLSESGFFNNPYVPFVPAVAALVILVVGGLLAGFVPAKRAMAIKAIEALREE